MLIGVLSDTHDQAVRTRTAVELLQRLGVQALIHCGDITSETMLDFLIGPIPAYFVFGNNDWDHDGLKKYAQLQNITCLGYSGIIELANKKIGIAHGDRPTLLRELATTEGIRYILSGHTHQAADEQIGSVRWVNPGALQRTRAPSVCTIDLIKDAVQFHML